MIKEHSPFYKNCPSTYKVNIYLYDNTKEKHSEQANLIASFCCAYCKMWDICEQENLSNNKDKSKCDVCYISKEVKIKMIPFTFGFSSGFSNSDFVLKAENKDQAKSIDKIRKHFLKKYKMR